MAPGCLAVVENGLKTADLWLIMDRNGPKVPKIA